MLLNDKTVSIIMPAYNAGSYISAAIDSVLAQSYANWELLIINNGSNDQTEEIFLSYDDKRIRYFKKETNIGVSAARNIGLVEMKGDFFCFLDADDIYPPRSIESRLNIFANDVDVDFVDGKVEYCDQDLGQKLKTWEPDFNGNPLPDLLSLGGKSFLGNTWMVKRDKNKKYAFQEDLTHSEDLLFCIQLALQGGKYGYTEDVILKYRIGHHSAMKNLKGLEDGYKKVYNFISQSPEISQELKNIFYKKSRSIMFKSYLGNQKLLAVLKLLSTKW